jgi:hypothetical protein
MEIGNRKKSGSHQVQTSWACGSQGIVRSLHAYSTCCIMLEQNCKKVSKLFIPKCQRNGKMCEDKWNALNFDYKILSDYHKGTKH